jgi:RNA polymerase sigma factor (sigma-70 family)
VRGNEQSMAENTTNGWVTRIVQRNDRDLRRYLSLQISNHAEVDDLAQEIYLRLLRIQRTDLIRSPEALLFRVASNAVYEWRLLARNRLRHGAADLDELESAGAEPATLVWRAEITDALQGALARLAPKCRAAVVLHRREQLTYAEVGASLGISTAMVKKYLTQGLAVCREYLRERLGLTARDMGDP